jgi:secreted PhoX family phosphatase
MTELDRRSFLRRGAAVAGSTAALGGPFAGYLATPAAAKDGRRGRRRPARPLELVDRPDEADGQTRLALPKGFRYRSFHASSKGAPLVLDDGARMPGRHDGMAAFRGRRDDSVLIRNHEENGPGAAFGPPDTVYDPMAAGGTTTVHVSGTGRVRRAYASLSGTQNNCSGGPMPWGAWVTCEETVNGYDVGDDFTRGAAEPHTQAQNSRLQKTHGFIFEVPVRGDVNPEPIRHAGRFSHEAVALDPHDGALYLTEDNFAFPSGFYKYVAPKNPRKVRRILDGGSLYMLKVKGVANADLSGHQARGTTYDVEWVEIDEPSFDFGRPTGPSASRTNDEALTFVSNQGLAKGAAKFARLEGAVYDHHLVYFTSTQGGAVPAGDVAQDGFGDGRGQIWAYDTRARKLTMLFESPSRQVLDFPDNVTTSPRGTLVVCEDGNFLRALTRKGEFFTFAQNRIAAQPNDEFAGSTFSRDGDTLFVNIQATKGLTFAIWGPWERIGV